MDKTWIVETFYYWGANIKFAKDDISAIHSEWSNIHEHSGLDDIRFCCVVVLKDGRFGYLSAWHDMRGWTGKSGSRSYLGDSLEDVVKYALTDNERKRMGYAE